MPTKKKVRRNTAKRPTFSIIGPGRLGMALALALDSAGYKIVSLVGRNHRKLRSPAKLLDESTTLLATKSTKVAKELTEESAGDLVIVAVPDDQIREVAKRLEGLETKRRRTVLHTSGALSSSVFTRLSKKGWHTGSIHPLASISDSVKGVEALKNAYWCVEGDAMAMRAARRIVADLGARSFSIRSEDKPLYHAAAVMSSGNVTALFDVALVMLERCGIARREAKKMLLPLVESAVANLGRFEPKDALTGSFARGDLATVKLHLAALRQKDLDEALRLYRLLGEHSVKLASSNLSSDMVGEILRNLRSEKQKQ